MTSHYEDSSDSDVDKDFATSTSCHGISYWYTSKWKWLKVLWIILVMGFTGTLIYQITLRIQNYYLYATSTDISEEFVAYLHFPAVTICNFNRYFLNNATDEQLQGIYALNQLTTASLLAFAHKNNQRGEHAALAGLSSNFNITEYTNEHGFAIDSSNMRRCTFKTGHCTEDNFTSVHTALGRCFTFNENASQTQNIPGSGNGLSMIIDARQYMYTEEPLSGITEAGIKVQVHPPDEAPDVETYGVAVPVGQKAFIEITRVDNEIMYEPWGRCNPKNEALKYFDTYSLNNCIQECYTDAVVEACGCRLNTQYWDTTHSECTTEQMFDCAAQHLVEVKQNFSAIDCSCTIPCSFTDYQLSVAYATFPGYTTRLHIEERSNFTSDDYVADNMVKLEVFFGKMSYRSFKQSKKVDESGLLSDVGGQLGLWCGMSFVTAIEFLQYIALKGYSCRSYVSKTRTKKKIGAKTKNSSNRTDP